jgi:hypothetical protein
VLTTAEAREFVTGVLAVNRRRPVARAAEHVFEGSSGIAAAELRQLLIGREETPDIVGARHADQLAELFGCRRVEASALLGVSDSSIRRNGFLDRGMLDRAYASIDAYGRVAAAIRPENGARWFNTPHQALGGEVPRELLKSQYGRCLVDDLVSAALAGSYV